MIATRKVVMGLEKFKIKMFEKLEKAWAEGNVKRVKLFGKELFGGGRRGGIPSYRDVSKGNLDLTTIPRYANKEKW